MCYPLKIKTIIIIIIIIIYYYCLIRFAFIWFFFHACYKHEKGTKYKQIDFNSFAAIFFAKSPKMHCFKRDVTRWWTIMSRDLHARDLFRLYNLSFFAIKSST